MAVTDRFKVVINHEEQYSIWRADRPSPRGWKEIGKTGTQEECIQYIEEVWTDMRPAGLRQKLQSAVRTGNLDGLKK